MLQPILYTHDTAATLDRLIDEMQPDKVVLLTDDTTRKLCLPHISMSRHAANAQVVSIRPTDVNKTLQTLPRCGRRWAGRVPRASRCWLIWAAAW